MGRVQRDDGHHQDTEDLELRWPSKMYSEFRYYYIFRARNGWIEKGHELQGS